MAEISFEKLKTRYRWKPIGNCPGRFVLEGGISQVTPEALCRKPAKVFPSTRLPDLVYVISVINGGIISYQKKDGGFIHTLCDEEGFSRKLNDIGVS